MSTERGISRCLVPYVMFRDRCGFRLDGPVLPTKEPGELRIFVLGGSAVYAGSTTRATIPGQMEIMLRNAGVTGARVYNYGIPSGISGQSLSLLVHELASLNPDFVVTFDGGDDLTFPWLYDPRPGHPFNFFLMEGVMDAMSEGHGRSFCINDVSIDMAELRKRAGYGSAVWEQQVADAYAGSVEKMAKVCAGFGITYFSFLQPTVHTKTPLVGSEIDQLGERNFIAYVERQYDRVRARLSSRMKGRWFDLTHAFNGSHRPLFDESGGLMDESNALIATHILECLGPIWRRTGTSHAPVRTVASMA